MARRWRLWACFQEEAREEKAAKEINYLRSKGFRAKRWATRPEHYTSGHIHIVVLSTFDELLELAGIAPRR